jgi:hypothetical protein
MTERKDESRPITATDGVGINTFHDTVSVFMHDGQLIAELVRRDTGTPLYFKAKATGGLVCSIEKPSPQNEASPRAPTLTDSEVTVLNATRNALNETGLPWGKHYNYAMTLLEMLDGLHERTSAYANQDAAPVSVLSESGRATPAETVETKPKEKPEWAVLRSHIAALEQQLENARWASKTNAEQVQHQRDRIAALEAEVERLKGQADE